MRAKRFVFVLTKGLFTAGEIEENGSYKKCTFHAEPYFTLQRPENLEDAIECISPNDEIEDLNPTIVVVFGEAKKEYCQELLRLLENCPRVSVVAMEVVLPLVLLAKGIEVKGSLEIAFYNESYQIKELEDESLEVLPIAEQGEQYVELEDSDFRVLLHLPKLTAGAGKAEIAALKAEWEKKLAAEKAGLEKEKNTALNEQDARFKKLWEELEQERDSYKAKLEEIERKEQEIREIYQRDNDKGTVTFGEWNGQPIEWLELHEDRQNKKVLLISADILGQQAWTNRESWLNNTFKNAAFTEKEAAYINGEIFLLSKEDYVEKFQKHLKHSGKCGVGADWWLGSASAYGGAWCVSSYGSLGDSDNRSRERGVRPALWLKLEG